MKQAVKSALGLGTAAAVAPVASTGVLGTTGLSTYGPQVATIPVAQTVTVPTVVDTVETVQTPIIKETTTVQKQVIPAIVEHREVAPVVHQRIRQEEVEEIQPVIHREREKTEIHKILQPMYTTATMGIAAEERTLSAQVRPEIRLSGAPPPAAILPTTQYESAQRVRVDKAPIVMETERKKIIEEVQPVVYKEIIQPHVIHVTQPIYEKIVEADIYVERVLPAQTFLAQTTTVQQPIIQQTVSAPAISATSVNIAEPTSAFTQTYDITTPVNAPGITGNRIEGVSQGVQVAPIGVSVQPLGGQASFSSGSLPSLQQSTLLGQSSYLGSSSLAQPSLGLQQGFQQPLAQQGFQQGFQQPLAQQGLQQGFQQPLMQPGLQQGFQQPLMQSGLGLQQGGLGMQQPYMQSGLGQPGLGLGQQGLGMQQPLMQSGLGQSGLGLGQSNLGYGQQGGFAQGLTSGIGQQMGQQMGQQLGSALGGGFGKSMGGIGGALGSAATSAF